MNNWSTRHELQPVVNVRVIYLWLAGCLMVKMTGPDDMDVCKHCAPKEAIQSDDADVTLSTGIADIFDFNNRPSVHMILSRIS